MELFDILDKDGNKTGEIKSRDIVHRMGYWHRAVHVWCISKDKKILLQRRADWIRTNAGMWDVAVGGHLESGEESIVSAIREAQEEIGVDIAPEELKFLFSTKRQSIKNNNNYINNEVDDVYILKKDLSTEDFKKIGKEVGEVKWVSLEDFRDMFKRQSGDLVIYEDEYQKILDYIDRSDN